jgi:hypothetical protein
MLLTSRMTRIQPKMSFLSHTFERFFPNLRTFEPSKFGKNIALLVPKERCWNEDSLRRPAYRGDVSVARSSVSVARSFHIGQMPDRKVERYLRSQVIGPTYPRVTEVDR